ncbi:ribose 5-phosphate isomerase [Azospirillum thiophilum]|uniref:Ribose 5-phosphate isomerase n=1 Tax=Azospirillum thiophilum TaxID=528244 RepID=A0AAC8ZU89_9PROT|nr:ribose 5-phosphate isomerase B [Azospirillum thiophilum]ALG71080.1 ribose 5-phosphate isomerase [Azospirillum thiophilum]KJR65260.1 ribose 5-phosphate isomerase [Azospirillum thiophilum]
MTVRTVALASDHAGYELKAQIAGQLEGAGYTVLDLGTDGPASVDYPDFAAALAVAVTDGRAQRGVLICGSGIGISIAANRHPGIRAALVHDVTTARLSREHNDANVIALGARIVGPEIAKDCVEVFLKAGFEGGERHSRRIAKMG